MPKLPLAPSSGGEGPFGTEGTPLLGSWWKKHKKNNVRASSFFLGRQLVSGGKGLWRSSEQEAAALPSNLCAYIHLRRGLFCQPFSPEADSNVKKACQNTLLWEVSVYTVSTRSPTPCLHNVSSHCVCSNWVSNTCTHTVSPLCKTVMSGGFSFSNNLPSPWLRCLHGVPTTRCLPTRCLPTRCLHNVYTVSVYTISTRCLHSVCLHGVYTVSTRCLHGVYTLFTVSTCLSTRCLHDVYLHECVYTMSTYTTVYTRCLFIRCLFTRCLHNAYRWLHEAPGRSVDNSELETQGRRKGERCR
jgi:hypothetical protein